MASGKDYYEILGVAETATADEIKKAYRRLARKHHPDRNPGDASAEERFKVIQEAYDVLSDEKGRRGYDRARRNPFGSAFGGDFETSTGGRFYRAPDGTFVRQDPRARYGQTDPDDGMFGGLGDILGRMFGAEPEPGFHSRPPDTELSVRLTFDQMLEGGKADVRMPDGRMARVPYPSGVRDGYRVRLRNGTATARSGTLYVRFHVGSHPDFEREGNDLKSTIRINAVEAMLGTSRSLTTPYGKTLKVTIPAGAQPGERMRLRGQGIHTDKGAGDLHVIIEVTVPKDLSPEAREAIRTAADKAGLI